MASVLRSPLTPLTWSTTVPRPCEPHHPLCVLSCQAPWDPSVLRGSPTCRWIPGTPKIWQTKRRKDFFPKGRNSSKDCPLLNNQHKYHKRKVRCTSMTDPVNCIHTINSDPMPLVTVDKPLAAGLTWARWSEDFNNSCSTGRNTVDVQWSAKIKERLTAVTLKNDIIIYVYTVYTYIYITVM